MRRPTARKDRAVPEFEQAHSRHWIEHFAGQGYDVRPLAAGVEGAIYDLGDGRIAKVWRDRRVADLERMRSLYADVAAAGPHFSTPEILAVERVHGMSVTYERKLPGQPLQQRLAFDDHALDPAAARCVIDVLRALAAIPATGTMRQLAVLDEGRPLWAGADTFRAALVNLLRRRAARFGAVIRGRLPDFDRRYAALMSRLETLAIRPDTVIHGDLVPGNILVDAQARPLAVVDFGFLTTAGDPRFDAAIAASVMNMYGPRAPAITEALTAQVALDLGYPVEVLLIYQAAYAVATTNAFTSDGSDGHFAWCVSQLRRPEVTDALGL
jgi:aminoglycoside phosphotransferase (APT) family kinase protein